jgi:hypothetical protein
MKTLYLQAMTLGVVVGWAGAVFAQDVPQTPPVPPAQAPFPGRTIETPQGLAPPPPVRDEPWAFSAGFNGAYEGNALFVGPSDDSQFSNAVQASIGRAWRLRRGDAQLGANAAQVFYQDTPSLNDFRYTVVGGLGYSITRRLTWTGNVSLSSGLARDAHELTDSGAVLPSTATTRSSTGSSLFSYALTRKSTVTWSLATSGVGFSSAAFNGGTQLSTTGTYTRLVGSNQTVGGSVDYSRSFEGDLSSNVYGVNGLWSLSTTRGWLITASGGVRPYSVARENERRITSAFTAGVTKPVRRNQTMGVMYSKSVEQTFGLRRANNLVQTITGNYTVLLHRNLTGTFAGTLAQSTDPVLTEVSTIGRIAQASLNYRVLTNLLLSVGTTYYSRQVESLERTSSTVTSLALSYSTTW